MAKPLRTRSVNAAQVRAYAGKAQEFADAAQSELDAGRFIAATSLAIHAAINAADAVCGARLGQRAAGDDHGQVITLLSRAGPDGLDVERDLRRLIPLKTTPSTSPTTYPKPQQPKQLNGQPGACRLHDALRAGCHRS
jgi:hypothetical protein